MIIQTVFTYEDGERMLWDTENQCYLVRSKEPKSREENEDKESYKNLLTITKRNEQTNMDKYLTERLWEVKLIEIGNERYWDWDGNPDPLIDFIRQQIARAREEAIRSVLPEKGSFVGAGICREEIKRSAKEKWGMEL